MGVAFGSWTIAGNLQRADDTHRRLAARIEIERTLETGHRTACLTRGKVPQVAGFRGPAPRSCRVDHIKESFVRSGKSFERNQIPNPSAVAGGVAPILRPTPGSRLETAPPLA